MNEWTAIRNVVERDTARRLCADCLKAVHSLPEAERLEAATSKLHRLLLQEMVEYKDRLNEACKAVLQEAMREVQRA